MNRCCVDTIEQCAKIVEHEFRFLRDKELNQSHEYSDNPSLLCCATHSLRDAKVVAREIRKLKTGASKQ